MIRVRRPVLVKEVLQEQVATRRALAERDLAKKRNELHPELQEFLGNYDSNTKNEIDK